MLTEGWGTSSGQSSQLERAPVTKAGTMRATEQWSSWIKTPGIKSPTVHEWMKEKRQLLLTEELELIHVEGEGTRESPGEPHRTGCCRPDPQGMLRLVSESGKGNGIFALFLKQFYSKTCITWKNSSFTVDRPADIIWSKWCMLAPHVMTCPCSSWCDILTKTQEPWADHEDMPGHETSERTEETSQTRGTKTTHWRSLEQQQGVHVKSVAQQWGTSVSLSTMTLLTVVVQDVDTALPENSYDCCRLSVKFKIST